MGSLSKRIHKTDSQNGFAVKSDSQNGFAIIMGSLSNRPDSQNGFAIWIRCQIGFTKRIRNNYGFAVKTDSQTDSQNGFYIMSLFVCNRKVVQR